MGIILEGNTANTEESGVVTQLDVARHAGVGRRTVSHVVTGFPHVSNDVRERVLRSIEVLGYVPNRAARQLRTGRSGVIALMVPELGVGYFGELGNLIIEEVATRGLGTVVAQTRGSRTRELAEMERIIALQPEGLIVSPLGLTKKDLESLTSRTRLAVIGEHFVDSDEGSIAVDNVSASREMVEHLLNSGRRHIVFVGAAGVEPQFNRMRREGYSQAMENAGLDANLDIQIDGFTADDGYVCGDQVARSVATGTPIDAVYCVTDEVALGFIRALHDARIRVPDDIAVAAFDDIVEGRFSTPRLTTVAPDKAAIAHLAVNSVLGGSTTPSPVKYSLKLRESTEGVQGRP